MTVKPAIYPSKHPNNQNCHKNEIAGQNWIGDERVKCLVREVASIIQRITFLPPRRKRRKKHKSGGMEKKDCFNIFIIRTLTNVTTANTTDYRTTAIIMTTSSTATITHGCYYY